MQEKPSSPLIPVEKEGLKRLLSLSDLEKLTGASFIPRLDFFSFSIQQDIVKRCLKCQRKSLFSKEQVWLGAYFRKELSHPFFPDIYLRWIDPTMGWGVFAARNFKKMEFIAEYTGKVRRRKRKDQKNSYCFEYLIAATKKTPYIIDACEQGGISRYINHSNTPNLISALATYDNISHVVLYTKEAIAKGAELTYDYGPDYWSHRPPPR